MNETNEEVDALSRSVNVIVKTNENFFASQIKIESSEAMFGLAHANIEMNIEQKWPKRLRKKDE